ncbi:MAG TPA: acireductone synthase [Pseudomonadales bacterium]|nr:acireductone synthase [Pseudomonadales bacterium]
MTLRAIVTDIEGTTTDIHFVHRVLFPYAAERLEGFIRQHGDEAEVAALLDQVREEIRQPQATAAALVDTLQQWIKLDLKLTPLKSLQGLIWREGYQQGHFTAHVYPEVAAALRDWQRRGLALYVYSSGSVEAQRLLFAHTQDGDLTPLFSGYFDTRIGAKRERSSYDRIAEQIGLAGDEILFLSDVEAELDAAAAAGFHTCLLLRDGANGSRHHPSAHDFEQIPLLQEQP